MRWKIGAAAALGRSGHPGLDSGGGGVGRHRTRVRSDGEEKAIRVVAVAKAGSDGDRAWKGGAGFAVGSRVFCFFLKNNEWRNMIG